MNTVFIIVFWVLMGGFSNLKMLFTYSSIFYECKNSQNTQAVLHKNLHILGYLIVFLILLKLSVSSIPKVSADN
ncbi:hypothetical protein COD88_10505 [Bacillus cereus]|nr:hypothetical protein COD88_10505 [Bacillus cereus]